MNGKIQMKIFILALLFLSNCIYAKKLEVLPEILKPSRMAVDGSQLYIRERETIYLYSLENFKLLKKFGGMGEGPGEFKYPPSIRIYPEYLILEDIGNNRISFFTRDGILKNCKKVPECVDNIYKVGNYFIGTYGNIDPKTMITTKNIILYTKEFKPIKELYNWQGQDSISFPIGSNKRFDWEVIKDYLGYSVYNDRIYLADTRKGFFIAVYDSRGNKIYDIEKKYKKKRVTESYKNKYKKDMQKIKHARNLNFVFRDYYPAFEKFEVTSGKIYIWTYEKKDEKYELIILDFKGNILRRAFLSWRHPYSLNDFKYYYLVENEEEEMGELHADDLK